MDIIFNTRTFFVTHISRIEYEFPTYIYIYGSMYFYKFQFEIERELRGKPFIY